MRTHPVFLRLDGRRCVVVGGDQAAAAKAVACLEAGASVTVVAEAPEPALVALAEADRIGLERRPYREGDLAGALVAYVSTREAPLVATVRDEAERERVLLNVIDVPDACTFLSPAVLARGALQVAIGTGGESPALAARLRRDLERAIGPEYAPYVAILGAVRRFLAADGERAVRLGRLVDSDLLALVRRGERAGIDRVLADVAGGGCTLARLGVTLDGPAGASTDPSASASAEVP